MILFFVPLRKPSFFKIVLLAPLILIGIASLLAWWGLSR